MKRKMGDYISRVEDKNRKSANTPGTKPAAA